MPPTSDATTAVAHGIASKLTIPSGSYTDGHTKTVAAESISRILLIGSISRTQNTPVRARASSWTAPVTSAAISVVSGAPTHNTSWMSGVNRCAAAIRCGTPFWRVILPTNATIGRVVSTPSSARTDSPGSGGAGYQTSVSIPLRTICTRFGSNDG